MTTDKEREDFEAWVAERIGQSGTVSAASHEFVFEAYCAAYAAGQRSVMEKVKGIVENEYVELVEIDDPESGIIVGGCDDPVGPHMVFTRKKKIMISKGELESLKKIISAEIERAGKLGAVDGGEV